MEFTVHRFAQGIIICIMFLMIISRYAMDGMKHDKEGYTLGVTGIISILTIISISFAEKRSSTKINYGLLFSLGIFVITSLAYTIYEWDTIDKGDKCSAIIPKSKYFNSADYYIYRIVYLLTLVILVSLLQYKIDDSSFAIGNSKPTLHMLLFSVPLLLPMMTEFVTWLTNMFPGPETNPESLLLNFIKGDSKQEWDTKTVIRSAMPILFYISLMGLSLTSVMGKYGLDATNIPIYIIIGILVFFSFIMRTTFIQKCSLDKNINKTDKTGFEAASCSIEKYGGLQVMLNICLMIIIIYHINNPIYKLLFSIIIGLGVWGLSTTYILNYK
jgi:hypothetical protein